MSLSPCVSSRLLPRALGLASLLAPCALAGESLGHGADLRFGPIVGGQPVRVELATSSPSAPFALLVGVDGAPTPIGKLEPLGVNLGLPYILYINVTDAHGRFVALSPTVAGQFGPAGSGNALFAQALVLSPLGKKLESNVAATEIEPMPTLPGYLTEEASTHLPVGYDALGGNAVEAADIDHDGATDLLIATDFDVRVWMNDGTAQFADETAARITWPGETVATLRTADLDADGDTDLLTGGGYDDFFSPPNRLWLNDDTGVFTEFASFPDGVGLTAQFEVGDFTGDGLPDIVAANGSEGHLSVAGGESALLFNTGDAVFVESVDFASETWNDPDMPTTVARAGDVDQDGDLDLFLGKADTTSADGIPGQPDLMLRNDGTGDFTLIANTLSPTLHDNTQDARLVDLDGDLDLDIVVANSVLSVSAALSGDVWWNQGGKQAGTIGTFKNDPSSFLEANTFGDGIRLGMIADDLDADGDIDVVVTVHDLFQGADQMLFLNQGGAQHGTEGAMVRQTWFDPPFSGTGGLGDFICWGSAAFDADDDGDKDLILCANGVVSGDPADSLTTRFLINGKL